MTVLHTQVPKTLVFLLEILLNDVEKSRKYLDIILEDTIISL